jgi:tetratricopeptide (TPR) repeat protein
MLEGTVNESLNVNVELKRIVAEIYTFVISAQVKYCKLDMKHPFLEGTYMNIGIFNRTMKRFGESLMMWKKLETLQKDMYGDDHMSLLYTYKNIGTCYLGIGQSDKAKSYFEDCVKLLAKQEQTENAELKKKDNEELA